MSKYIYNEGRVVGYSAYEIYVMQHLNTVPESDLDELPPATEREWLAASLGSGASMLLRIEDLDIPAGQSYGYVQIPLPADSMLCAANTIVASFFEGEGVFGTLKEESLVRPTSIKCKYGWATAVSSYGDLIINTSSRNPANGGSTTSGIKGNVPPTYSDLPLDSMSDDKINELKDYMHIVDGIVVQPGTWANNTGSQPGKLLTPNLAQCPVLRFKYSKSITKTTILLTGFTNRAIVAGESGFPVQGGTSATDNPQNGDFLGPEAFPWANKIIFSVPSSFMHYFFESGYARRIGTGGEVVIDDTAIIDLKSSQAASYYQTNDTSATVDLEVTELNTLGEGAAALTLYSRRGVNGPSALYESRVEETGETKMYPVDVVVPGTVKMYTFASGSVPTDIKTKISKLETIESGNLGFARRSDDYVIFQRDSEGNYLPIANTQNDGTLVTNTAGKKSTKSLAMEDEDGNAYNVSTYPEAVVSPKDDNIWWVSLIAALHNNQGIDILGSKLKDFKSHLPNIESTGVLKLTGTGASSVGGSFTAGKRIKSGATYIEFSNGLRLYISSNEPTSSKDNPIPVGSIGIGWVADD